MTLVVDANVAVKWVLAEDGTDRASALRRQPEELIAPTLIVAEIGSTMRKRAATKELTAAEALNAAKAATDLIDRLVPMPELAARALELAIELKHPIYDCFYLALAQRDGIALITADQSLITKAKAAKIDVKAL